MGGGGGGGEEPRLYRLPPANGVSMAVPAPTVPAVRRAQQRRRPRMTRARRWFPLWLIAPATLLLVLITVLPFLDAVRTSLTTWNVLSTIPPRFVWFQNYRDALTDPLFWSSFKVTLIFVGGVIVFQLTIGLAIALLINNLPRGQQRVATVIVLPVVLAPMVVGFQWRVLFDGDFGPLDYLLQQIGLPALAWTGDARLALPALMLVDFWEWTPFVVLLLYAGLRSLPRPVFEASRVDGSRHHRDDHGDHSGQHCAALHGAANRTYRAGRHGSAVGRKERDLSMHDRTAANREAIQPTRDHPATKAAGPAPLPA